ncbi:CRISPR-associated protein Cas4 [Actinophytocola sediminis]
MTLEAVGQIPDSIPLSALEHVEYCRRQAALIHIEATWTDSVDTVRGDLLHRTVDLPAIRNRRGVRVVRTLPVRSERLGLHGVCDLVEIEGSQATPVEYKVGRYLAGGPADVQVAAQAACLIDSGFEVAVGYIYSGADRRRHPVDITEQLLTRVTLAAEAMRALYRQSRLPSAHNDRRCRRCSLQADCLPELTNRTDTEVDLFAPRSAGTWHD